MTRNQVWAEAVVEVLTPCNTGGLQLLSHYILHPIKPVAEPLRRPGQVLNYLLSLSRCVRCAAKAHAMSPKTGGSARDLL